MYWLNPILKSEQERKAYFYTVSGEHQTTDSPPYIYLRLQSEPFSKISTMQRLCSMFFINRSAG